MAVTYTATLEVQCWKEHTCSACGTVYRYLFTRTRKGKGGSEEQAHAAATNAVIKALDNEVEMRPCLTCGHFQPEMIGFGRARWHFWLLIGTAVALALALFLGITTLVTDNIVPYVSAAIAAIFLALSVAVILSNPNKNLNANQEQAMRLVESGVMEVRQKAASAAEASPRLHGPPRAAGWSLIGGMALGCVLMLTAELVRIGQGWPINAAWYPVVAGPGDSPYTWFPDRIECVKSYWTGTASATVANANEIGLANPRLSAKTRNTTWGDRISVKSSSGSTPRLWERVHLPKEPQLAGKTLRIAMSLSVEYPKPMGDKKFDNVREMHSHTAEIKLGSLGAGGTYVTCWWIGLLLGGVVVSGLGLALYLRAKALRRTGLATQVYPRETPPETPPEVPAQATEPPFAEEV